MGLDLPLQGRDLGVERGDDRDQRGDRDRVGVGELGGLAQRRRAQRGLNLLCAPVRVTPARPPTCSADPRQRQAGCGLRGRGRREQLQGVAVVQAGRRGVEGRQRGGEAPAQIGL
jgi:hypothetical protein